MGRSGNPASHAQQARVRRALRGAGSGAVRSRFYCDESGNTGVHWGDPEQPIFVHGGWLVPIEAISNIIDGVADLRRRNRLRAPELKWQQLARREDPGAVFRGFFETVLDGGGLPFFWVMEKDFITGAKIVETFFDPAYNHHYPIQFTGARDIKKELAEAVSHSAEVLQRFGDLMRAGQRPPAGVVREVAARLANHFQAGNAPALADSLRDFSDEAISAIQGEVDSATWMRTTVGHSLPALMQLLEGFMRKRQVELEIVHDNLVRYEPAFDFVRSMFRPPEGTDFTMVGDRPFYHSMPTVTGLRLADSKSEPMIQLADLLCGFVRTAFTKIKNSQDLTPGEQAVCLYLALAQDRWSSWDANMPQWMWQSFARWTVGAMKGQVGTSA